MRMVAISALLSCAVAGCGILRFAEPADPIVTGSLKAQPAVYSADDAPAGIAGGDWALAKSALQQAIASSDTGASIPWDNPKTGARGTATPIGAATADGCRDFRIGVVDATGEQWVQGAACRDAKGTVSLSQVRVLGRA